MLINFLNLMTKQLFTIIAEETEIIASEPPFSKPGFEIYLWDPKVNKWAYSWIGGFDTEKEAMDHGISEGWEFQKR